MVVRVEGCEPPLTQAPCHAAHEQLLLGVGQRDACFAVDQIPEVRKPCVAEIPERRFGDAGRTAHDADAASGGPPPAWTIGGVVPCGNATSSRANTSFMLRI